MKYFILLFLLSPICGYSSSLSFGITHPTIDRTGRLDFLLLVYDALRIDPGENDINAGKKIIGDIYELTVNEFDFQVVVNFKEKCSKEDLESKGKLLLAKISLNYTELQKRNFLVESTNYRRILDAFNAEKDPIRQKILAQYLQNPNKSTGGWKKFPIEIVAMLP